MKDVLLADSSVALLAARLRTLRATGYQVTSVTSVEDAARAIKDNSYDLVIADAEVPELFEVLPSTMVPTMIIVDGEKAGLAARELPMGFWALLVKPFTAARFQQAVAEAIERADALKGALQQRASLPLKSANKPIVTEPEMGWFFRDILGMAAAETEADGLAILILGENNAQVTIKARIGLHLGSTDACIRLGRWTIKTAKSLVVNEKTEVDPDVRQTMAELGASSLLSVPLITRDKAIGAIIAFKVLGEASFTAASLEFLSILANETATAIENTSLSNSVERQQQELETLLEKAVQNQESERERVAVEIHDGIGQKMVGALYRIQSFTSLLSKQKFNEAREEAEEIQELLKKTLVELRRVLVGLRPYSLEELGLAPALQQETDYLAMDTNTVCQFTTDGPPVTLTSSQEASIYRVAQEALANVRKHAGATKVSVKLQYQPGAVSLTVRDNGKGFKLNQANKGLPLEHIGLASMKERAELMGGNLNISSSPGNGTSVELTIPIKEWN